MFLLYWILLKKNSPLGQKLLLRRYKYLQIFAAKYFQRGVVNLKNKINPLFVLLNEDNKNNYLNYAEMTNGITEDRYTYVGEETRNRIKLVYHFFQHAHL